MRDGWGIFVCREKINPHEAGLIRNYIKTGLVNDLVSQVVYFSKDFFELG